MSLSEKDRTHDLQACPFCGCHGLSFAWPREFRGRMAAIIECHTDNCYALLTADSPDKAVAAWNRRAEGVAALQPPSELFAENAKKSSAKQIAENAHCSEGWVLVPREPTEEMVAAGSLAWEQAITWDAATDHPALAEHIYRAMTSLPQQTAVVEQGVEKIIGPHEPAACGASAPSDAPLSAEEVELPNYWRAVVGDTYKPAVLRNVKHMHPTTVKEVFDRYAGTDVADVIAGLIFKNQIANNRSEFFAEEYAKATASPPTPADEGEG